MPIFLLLTSYFVIEIYVLAKVWAAYGFVNTFFGLLASGVLGLGILRAQGRFLVRSLQDSLSRGQLPSDKILHGISIFFGGILFLLPGFVSDFVALFFVVPGLRHLTVLFLKAQLARKLKQGAFRMFAAGGKAGFGGGFTGFGGSGGRFGGFDFRTGSGAGHGGRREPPTEGWQRDVSPKVIDVAPIASEHTEVKPGSSSDD